MPEREPDPDQDQDDPNADAGSPVVDLSAALGEAGHEAEELGFDDVADTGPVLHSDANDPDVEHRVARSFAEEFPGD